MQPALAEMVVDAVTLLAKGLDREALMARAMELIQGSLGRELGATARCIPMQCGGRGRVARAQSNTGLGKLARVIADDVLPEDGCVLESDLGRVDASLSTQLQAIRAATVEAAGRMVGAATGGGTQV